MRVSLRIQLGPLRVDADQVRHHLDVRLRGELDFAALPSLQALEELDHTRVSTILIDLENLDYVDSAGVRTLRMYFENQAAQGRTVSLIGARPTVRNVLEVMGSGKYLIPPPPELT